MGLLFPEWNAEYRSFTENFQTYTQFRSNVKISLKHLFVQMGPIIPSKACKIQIFHSFASSEPRKISSKCENFLKATICANGAHYSIKGM